MTLRADFIHREILQLGCLALVAVAGFFATRAVAANNLDMRLRDAAEWYRQGEEALTAGRVDAAVDALRRAVVRDRGRKAYVLALARALALGHDEDAARGALLAVRESAPDDPEINLELARLAARTRDVETAVRYYHHALYAPWPPEQTEARRAVRIELIRFLLAQNQASRAASELLALANDLPDDVSHHVEVAALFSSAGDHAHAVDQYERALRLDPNNGDVLAAAGLASFKVGRYAAAMRYLRRGTPRTDEERHARAVAELVLTRDPLADRIGSAERRRRVMENVEHAQVRLSECLAQPNTAPDEGGASLQEELHALESALTPPRLDQDAIEAASDLVDRVERHVVQRCGPAAALDEALIVIARQHGSSAP